MRHPFIIGYVITPIIFGRQFKLNIVAVLFILFIGNQVAGVWGMILGVPVANYLLRDVLGVPLVEDKGKGDGSDDHDKAEPQPQDPDSEPQPVGTEQKG